ncbi:hypothetical protein [Enhygromyxa salina]|uniref:Energy transducer TonB n=1 Tax=Enhygromyxa salina TaxID=215803 RepID=A0A2S9YVD8_9BACT|nr:hypothetical protein [Enhygromyxa salina]PRQ09053.1 hypothetical protein ENSA7_10430 [Enhygromyxa salina]
MNTQRVIQTSRSRRRAALRLLCVGVALTTVACIARGPDDYRTVTRSLVDTKTGDIEGCFAGQKGKVVVNFTVEKKSGKVTNAVVDEKNSTASADVGTCVASKIEGLTLSEPDMRDGAASFTWQVTQ